MSSENPLIVESIPGWSHDIKNIGSDELIVMLWANEIFDKSTSLKGILEPFSRAGNVGLLKRAGFKDIEYIFLNELPIKEYNEILEFYKNLKLISLVHIIVKNDIVHGLLTQSGVFIPCKKEKSLL